MKKKELQHFHIVEVKYFGPTNSNGSRLRLISHRFEQAVTIPYDYSLNSTADMAVKWLTNNGHNVIGIGNGSKHNDIIVIGHDNNHSFKKLK